MGGFTGSDPAMTVGKLQQLLRSGQLRYVLAGGGGGRFGGFGAASGTSPGTGATGGAPGAAAGPRFGYGSPPAGGFLGGNGNLQSVMAWVTQNCKPVDYTGSGSTTSSGLYDCSTATPGV